MVQLLRRSVVYSIESCGAISASERLLARMVVRRCGAVRPRLNDTTPHKENLETFLS